MRKRGRASGPRWTRFLSIPLCPRRFSSLFHTSPALLRPGTACASTAYDTAASLNTARTRWTPSSTRFALSPASAHQPTRPRRVVADHLATHRHCVPSCASSARALLSGEPGAAWRGDVRGLACLLVVLCPGHLLFSGLCLVVAMHPSFCSVRPRTSPQPEEQQAAGVQI